MIYQQGELGIVIKPPACVIHRFRWRVRRRNNNRKGTYGEAEGRCDCGARLLRSLTDYRAMAERAKELNNRGRQI